MSEATDQPDEQAPHSATTQQADAAPALDPKDAEPVKAAIAANLAVLKKSDVLGIRPGYKVVAGWPTRKPAIVVTVKKKTDDVPEEDRLPDRVDGVAVDVREASRMKALELQDPAHYATIAPALPAEARVARFPDEELTQATSEEPALAPLAAKPTLPYTPPADGDLSPVEDDFTILCNASPDAGWPTLKTFLAGTTERLVVGLYDFTSEHILDAVKTDLSGKQLDLVLDHPPRNPTADQTDEETHTALADELGDNLNFAWALERMDPHAAVAIFPNAYHIKVAVRDGRTFWLSSGNWNNSNQPDIDPVDNPGDAAAATKFDRDWHVVVQHQGLAETFSKFLENDLSVAAQHQTGDGALAPAAAVEELALEPRALPAAAFAQFFAPQTFSGQMRVTPLLTPDPGVYSAAVLELVRSATQSLYIQTQYAHPSVRPEDEAFTELLEAVIDRQQAGVDVRIIFSQWENQGYLEKLQALGFDLTQVRIQQGVHNKGIVRDGSAVLISSENWSADGVLRNRDAGVIVENPEIAQYFQQIFVHDWTHLAQQQALDA
jgi:PLD-like domain